jgi:hypothetical protein
MILKTDNTLFRNLLASWLLKVEEVFEMRAIFGVLSVLLLVFVISLLARKQLGALSGMGVTPAASAAGSVPASTLQQSQQLQNQVRKSVEDAMQQARPQEEEK